VNGLNVQGLNEILQKTAFAPPMDPMAAAGAAPPAAPGMDPAAMGMDPAMMAAAGGAAGAPPMDPAAALMNAAPGMGAAPMDPAAMGMDPAAMGGEVPPAGPQTEDVGALGEEVPKTVGELTVDEFSALIADAVGGGAKGGKEGNSEVIESMQAQIDELTDQVAKLSGESGEVAPEGQPAMDAPVMPEPSVDEGMSDEVANPGDMYEEPEATMPKLASEQNNTFVQKEAAKNKLMDTLRSINTLR
jgi:hypothetical protein